MKGWAWLTVATVLAASLLAGCERQPPRTVVLSAGPSDDTPVAPAPAVPAAPQEPAPAASQDAAAPTAPEPVAAEPAPPVVAETPAPAAVDAAPPATSAMGAQPAASAPAGTAAPTELSPRKDAKVSSAAPAVRASGDAAGALLLAQRSLQLPVVGVQAASLSDQFDLGRGSQRKHEAIDILAPAGTPVVAVDDGRVAKLFASRAGGLTVYQFDPAQRLAYYYAHLQSYAAGVKEGMQLRRGDVIGYVGTSGNADPRTPHLHFAVFRLGNPPKWWEGEAVNPYPALRNARASEVQAMR